MNRESIVVVVKAKLSRSYVDPNNWRSIARHSWIFYRRASLAGSGHHHHPPPIQNSRRNIDDFKIGGHGFQFAKFPSSLYNDDFDNLKLVGLVYYLEVQDLVKTLFDKLVKMSIVNH
jgi:hypothetical protein